MNIKSVPEGLSLSQYLDLEQDMLQTIEEPTCFTWMVAPTVIYGRHQVREQEVNEVYCTAHGIDIVQRKSGGGCVYADRGNLMLSFITPSTHSETVFAAFMQMLSGALRQLGYQAVTTAHNDVLVGDRKVAGTACYTTATGTVVHASILYDVNMDALENAITPSVQKLLKHAVQSVRQRVINLRDINDKGDITAFRDKLENQLTQWK